MMKNFDMYVEQYGHFSDECCVSNWEESLREQTSVYELNKEFLPQGFDKKIVVLLASLIITKKDIQ